MRKNLLDPVKCQFVLDNYKDYSYKKLGEIIGLGERQVDYILRKNGLKSGRKGQFERKYKYTLNHEYFDQIDSHNKAYVLGFILADGCVSGENVRYALKVGLNPKDKCVLDFIQKELNNNSPYYYNKSNNSLCLNINSKHLVSSLMKVGIKPAKTYLTDIPKIPEEYKFSFFLGIFDGDGCIFTKYRQKGKYVSFDSKFTITGKHYQYIKNIKDMTGIEYGKIYKVDEYHVWAITNSKEILDVYNKIYGKTDFYLERKHKRFEEIINFRKGKD